MTSFEHLIGRAILSSDPAERQAAEDAVTVKLYASKALRDQSQFVVIEFGPGFGAPMPMDAATWDGVKDSEKIQAELVRTGARVLDGRILFAPKPRARKLRVTRATTDAASETPLRCTECGATEFHSKACTGNGDLTRDAAPAYGCAHMSGYACSDCAARNAATGVTPACQACGSRLAGYGCPSCA